MRIQASRREKIQYWIDNQFSRGPVTLIKWLGALSLFLIILAALFLSIFNVTPPGEQKITFFEAFWRSLMRTLDAGTMGGDEGFGYRIVMFLVTLAGIFVISTLIGILSAGVEAKLDTLKKGRSRVLETNHVILLGWGEQIFILLNELMVANENQEGAVLVVMGLEDKTVMEETIRERVTYKGKTKIVCRSGNPMDPSDLRMVSINSSRAIIIPSPGGQTADSQTIKTVLAVTNHPDRDPSTHLNIVAEILEQQNMEAARIIGNGEVQWLEVSEFISRIIAQTCRQSGLSVVYTELLDFGGDEIYYKHEPALAGKTFGEALLMYPKNAIMGVTQKDGNVRLNPPMDLVIQSDDEIIMLAEDDDYIFYQPEEICIQQEYLLHPSPPQQFPESALVLGWNRRGRNLIYELNKYAAPNSRVRIVADSKEIETDMTSCCIDLDNIEISFQEGEITSRSLLDSLNLKQFDHIILLCYSDKLETQQADAKTIITLLHLRDIATKKDYRFSIVSEMMDVRNRNLADVTRADDFIVSDRLVSLLMAQVAENPRLNLVFQDLFDPEGSEIYLKPISEFVKLGVPVNFYTVVESARQRDCIALGYHLHNQVSDPKLMYGVHLNPRKSDTITFLPDDRVIVLAEN